MTFPRLQFLQAAMQGLLEPCTPAQINQLIEVLQAVHPRNAESAAPNVFSLTDLSFATEYRQRMGWQLGPARADDEEEMPTARSPLRSGREHLRGLEGGPGDLHHYLSQRRRSGQALP